MKNLLLLALSIQLASAAIIVQKRVSKNKTELISARLVDKNITEKIELKNIRESISEKIPTPEIQFIEEMIPNDQAYLEAIDYIVKNDVLLFNSAGNGSQKNPPRQKIEEIILVCSVKSKNERKADKKSGFSNYGTGIDVCAPGDPILAPVQGKNLQGGSRYGELQGTSMAAPAAAAVAALIWSHNPNFTAAEVRARLENTADNIDDRNWFWYKGLLGKGRINAEKALR